MDKIKEAVEIVDIQKKLFLRIFYAFNHIECQYWDHRREGGKNATKVHSQIQAVDNVIHVYPEGMGAQENKS